MPEELSSQDGRQERSRATTVLPRLVSIVLVTLAGTVVYVLRRPDELAAPYLWVEESVVLHSWLENGWTTAFRPLQGELLAWTTGLLVASAEIGWRWMPQLNYLLALGTYVLTALMILVPRSAWGALPVRAVMVLFLAIVPVNPETYGVLLYSFWWTALWPVVLLGWSQDRSWWRLPLVVVAGLSSIPAAGCFVLYAVAARARRSRELALCAAALAACFGVQAAVYLTSPRSEALSPHWGKVLEQAVIYPADFVLGHFWRDGDTSNAAKAVVGAAICVLITGGVWLVRDPAQRLLALLVLLALGMYSFFSATPAALITNPINAGPRYYFLPFALVGLLLLLLAGAMGRRRLLAIGILAVVAVALLGVPESFQRRSAHFDWHDELVACARSDQDPYPLPVQYDGSRVRAWNLPVTPAFCASQLDHKDRAGSG